MVLLSAFLLFPPPPHRSGTTYLRRHILPRFLHTVDSWDVATSPAVMSCWKNMGKNPLTGETCLKSRMEHAGFQLFILWQNWGWMTWFRVYPDNTKPPSEICQIDAGIDKKQRETGAFGNIVKGVYRKQSKRFEITRNIFIAEINFFTCDNFRVWSILQEDVL